MKTSISYIATSITLPAGTMRKVDRQAERAHRTRSAQLSHLIEQEEKRLALRARFERRVGGGLSLHSTVAELIGALETLGVSAEVEPPDPPAPS